MSESVEVNGQSVPLYKTVMVPVDKLVLDDTNPRTVSDDKFDALKRSMIKEPDFIKVRPIIANTFEGREFVVIGGNQRLKAARALKMASVPVVFVHVDRNKETEWNLKDNIPTGDWDRSMLADQLTKLHSEEYDLSGIGFSGLELTDYMQLDMTPSDPSNDPDFKGTTPRSKKPIQATCPDCGKEFEV
jgi:ParB-like chromosome segregation protein Spo0J